MAMEGSFFEAYSHQSLPVGFAPLAGRCPLVDALIRQSRKLPDELYRSLTWDRGKELTDHKRFSMETDIDVYFCDPQSPWQRGSNENTNRLLRQYFPKGLDLAAPLPGRAEQGGASAQRAAQENAGLPVASRAI